MRNVPSHYLKQPSSERLLFRTIAMAPSHGNGSRKARHSTSGPDMSMRTNAAMLCIAIVAIATSGRPADATNPSASSEENHFATTQAKVIVTDEARRRPHGEVPREQRIKRSLEQYEAARDQVLAHVEQTSGRSGATIYRYHNGIANNAMRATRKGDRWHLDCTDASHGHAVPISSAAEEVNDER